MSTNSTRGNGPLAETVQEHLHGLMFALRARLHKSLREQGPDGLTPMELRVLLAVSRHPRCTQRDLVERSGRDKAQMTRLVAGLEARALLRREALEEDRRCLQLVLTPAGEKLCAELEGRRKQLTGELLAGFSKAELATLEALLERMRANLGEKD